MRNYLIESIDGLVADNEEIYFISPLIYALLRCDCCRNKVDIVAEFPEEVQIIKAFEKIIKCEKKIYLFPCFAEDIYCFDLEKNEFHKLNALLLIISEMPKRKVLEVLRYGKKIYCVCRCPNIVIVINSETDNVDIYKVPLDLLGAKKSVGGMFFSGFIKKDKLIFPYANNAIIKFSLNDNMFENIYLEEESIIKSDEIYDYFLGVCIDDNDNIWGYSVCGEIYKIVGNKKMKVNTPQEFIGIFNDGNHEQPGINNVFLIGEDICFVLRSECKIMKYNTITRRFTWCENSLSRWNDEGSQIAIFNYAQVDEETFWLYNRNDNAAYKWNYRKGFTEKIDFRISADVLLKSKLSWDYRLNILNSIKKENDLYGYILFIECGKEEEYMKKNTDYGEKIYFELSQ